ncbi:MAG: GNAT family N-acetyltransferase [Erythrobacter sp.]|nr:GNAT family N-acetyltransferase [Erythrobacter sp.]
MHTALKDGVRVCIRTLHAGDEARLRAGIERMSPRSRYLRFFSGARTPPDWVIERLLDADGDKHLAWGALSLDEEDHPAMGAVHAFRDAEHPDCAEFSVAILDEWHGRGLGKLLTATILLDAKAEGIEEFHADTLSENASAIDFVHSLGGRASGHDGATRSYILDVEEAIRRLRAECDPPGIAAVFKAFA